MENLRKNTHPVDHFGDSVESLKEKNAKLVKQVGTLKLKIRGLIFGIVAACAMGAYVSKNTRESYDLEIESLVGEVDEKRSEIEILEDYRRDQNVRWKLFSYAASNDLDDMTDINALLGDILKILGDHEVVINMQRLNALNMAYINDIRLLLSSDVIQILGLNQENATMIRAVNRASDIVEDAVDVGVSSTDASLVAELKIDEALSLASEEANYRAIFDNDGPILLKIAGIVDDLGGDSYACTATLVNGAIITASHCLIDGYKLGILGEVENDLSIEWYSDFDELDYETADVRTFVDTAIIPFGSNANTICVTSVNAGDRVVSYGINGYPPIVDVFGMQSLGDLRVTSYSYTVTGVDDPEGYIYLNADERNIPNGGYSGSPYFSYENGCLVGVDSRESLPITTNGFNSVSVISPVINPFSIDN